MPTARGFFKKLGSDTKKFFSKGGSADVGLRKFGNTLSKVGDVVSKVAPVISTFAPEIGVPLMAGGALAKTIGSTANAVRHGAQKGGSLVEKAQNIQGAVNTGIQAGMPQAQALGVNFA